MKEICDDETRKHVRRISENIRKQIGILFEHIDRSNPINLAEIHMMITDLDNALDETNELVGDEENRYVNHYRCKNNHKIVIWDDTGSCTCDDKCPQCNAPVEPYSSEDIREIEA